MIYRIAVFIIMLLMQSIASYAAAPSPSVGSWYEIPSSNMSAVLPSSSEAYTSLGYADGRSIMTAWNGGTWDSMRNRLIVYGGGHGDGGDNSVYVFDIDDQEWSRAWTTGTNANGWYASFATNYDLGFSPTNTTLANYPDGSPIVNHTYDGLIYDKASDSLLAFPNATQWRSGLNGVSDPRVHVFSFETESWNPSISTPTGGLGGTADTATAYDPVDNRVYGWGAPASLKYYDLATEDTVYISSYPKYTAVAEIDQKNRYLVGLSSVGDIWARDLDAGTQGNKTVTGGPASAGGGQGFVWDSLIQKLVMYQGGTSLWALNTDAAGDAGDPWTWTEYTATDGTDAGNLVRTSNGIRGRFQYDAEHNIYVVALGTTSNVWVTKITSDWGSNVARIVTSRGAMTYYTTVDLAFAALADGDTMTIKDGTYGPTGSYVVSVDNVTIQAETRRGVTIHNIVPSSAKLIQFDGDNLTFDGIIFEDAASGGAAIWAEAGYGSLTVRNCTFNNNYNGIVTGGNGDANAEFLIEYSEFYNNGSGGLHHAIYVGDTPAKATFQYNYFHSQNSGQSIKSRAVVNYVLYNRLTDETDGNYSIDLSDGGTAYIIGNMIEQVDGTDNEDIIRYGVELKYHLHIDSGSYAPTGSKCVVGMTSGAEGDIDPDPLCEIDCPDDVSGTWAGGDKEAVIQLWHWTPGIGSFINDEVLNLYQSDCTTLIQADIGNVNLPVSGWEPAYSERSPHNLYVINNTIVNEKTNNGGPRNIISAHAASELILTQNNILISKNSVYGWEYLRQGYGSGVMTNVTDYKVQAADAGAWTTLKSTLFTDADNYDWTLKEGAVAVIDQGTATDTLLGFDTTPIYQYVHPYSNGVRSSDGNIDIGAYEYSVGGQTNIGSGTNASMYPQIKSIRQIKPQ